MNRCIILANGEINDYRWHKELLCRDDIILCADGGANHAVKMGLKPHGIAGDLDSVTPENLQKLQALGTEVRRFPPAKDEVDTLLALEWAFSLNPTEILILGGIGSRLDHTIANVHLLLTGVDKGIRIRLINECQDTFLVTRDSPAVVAVPVGTKVSLLPLGESVSGIKTENLEFIPPGGELKVIKPVGISNMASGIPVKVSVVAGVLIVFLVYEN